MGFRDCHGERVSDACQINDPDMEMTLFLKMA